MKLTTIEATTLPDAWFQTVYRCLEVGREFTIDKGSYAGQKRLEFDYITIQVKNPNGNRTSDDDLLPHIPEQYNLPDPVSEGYLIDYVPYLMTGECKIGEDYTYGSRLRCRTLGHYTSKGGQIEKDKEVELQGGNADQIERVIDTYKEYGYRNNQMVLQIAQPSDIDLVDPPCLRHIDTRIQDGALHFVVYFRSWDLWGGFPANLAAIQILKEYMAAEIGVGDGEIIASSKGLHLYDYTWELAEIIRGKTIEEFRKGI